jgi:hypothetical protein
MRSTISTSREIQSSRSLDGAFETMENHISTTEKQDFEAQKASRASIVLQPHEFERT